MYNNCTNQYQFYQKKFDALVSAVRDNVDILMMSETKIDNSFHTRQFLIEGFTTPYRLDRNGSGRVSLVYLCEDIPSELIPADFSNREGLFPDLNLRKTK